MIFLDKILILMILLLVRKKLYCVGVPQTPCPSIFLYKFQSNVWYGEMKILVPDLNTNQVHLEVAYFLRTRITTNIDNSLNVLDTDAQFASNIENGKPVTFILSFPLPRDPPWISEIKLNGNVICSGQLDNQAIVKAWVEKNVQVKRTFETIRVGLNGKPLGSKLQRPVQQPQQQQPQIQQPQRQQPQIDLGNDIDNRIFIPTDSTDICGTIPKALAPLQLIVNGENGERQPWLVALFDNDARGPTFFCAATLISSRFVVTAAHCTINKNYILLKLGGKDISSINEAGGTIRISEAIINHQDYRRQSSNADIAIVKMSEPVYFNNNIRPVCLWPNSYLEERHIVSRRATIYGWGNDEIGQLTRTAPKRTTLIIKPFEECKQMNILGNVISDKTICASGENALSGPCIGDSGGGLYVLVQNKWTIRGVISAAIGQESSGICDVQNYFSVYTDTGKYFNWIQETVNTV